jgi:hypothetical protein
MDSQLLLQVGRVAGLGGVALGVLLIVFREVLRKNIFPQLPKTHAYKILRLIVILTFGIAALGISAWVYVETHVTMEAETSFPSEPVEPVNQQYLALVDGNRFRDAWDAMADFARKRYQPDSMQQAYQAQRTPLGPVVSRTISGTAPVRQLMDGTRGAFTLTSYVTRYTNVAGPFREQVFVVAEGGRWKVFAHTNEPCPVGACPDLAPAPPTAASPPKH